MIQPTNEAETIELFNLAGDLLGWHIVEFQSNRFPDAVIENASGQRLTAEFEHCARNFQAHGHDSMGCDLVICWANDWPDAPLPVWALKDNLLSCLPTGLTWTLLLVEALDNKNLRCYQKVDNHLALLLERTAHALAQATQILEEAQAKAELVKRVETLEGRLRRALADLEREKRRRPVAGHMRLAGIETSYSCEGDGFLLWELLGDLKENSEANAILDDWELQAELVHLAGMSGAHTGFDMTHPVWTDKPRERMKLRESWVWAHGKHFTWWERIPEEIAIDSELPGPELSALEVMALGL